jgi:putative transposase
MRRYTLGAHIKTDLKVHLVWIPKYRKRVLTGYVAIRARDILRRIVAEHELEIMTGNVARDHVHMFIAYRPTQQISTIMPWLKGISSRLLLSEFPQLQKQFWGRHSWPPRDTRPRNTVPHMITTAHSHARPWPSRHPVSSRDAVAWSCPYPRASSTVA